MILESAIVTVLRDADRAATLALNDFDSAFTDAVMPLVSSHAFIAAVYMLLACYIFFRLGWKKALVVVLVAALSIGIADQIANLVKHSVERLRPCWDEFMVSHGLNILEKKGSRFGFYSAHSATAASVLTVAVCLMRDMDKKAGFRALIILGMAWILLISISRVYVGKHFVGDTIAGAAAGCVISYAIVLLARWVLRRYFIKFVA